MSLVKQLMEWHCLKGASTPFREAAEAIQTLLAALDGVMDQEPEHCPCGSRGCTEHREAWTKAREALTTVRRKV